MTTISKLKTELSELEIKSAGLKKDAAIVNDAVVNIKLEISRKMADIINAKNEENEPTAAEKWLKSERGWMYFPESMKQPVGEWVVAAHEAGQKHQAGVERERVRPLVEYIKRLVDDWKNARQVTFSERIRDLAKIIRNLEETEPGHGGGLSEKPSWAEPEGMVGRLQERSAGGYGYKMKFELEQDTITKDLFFCDLNSRYKLTPIKD